jgi:catechol 2,3-dioxygenase-like lactoylglutathione lyase family enzyme
MFMFAKIRHVACHTERYDTMAKFYQTIFGMKQITTGLVDETGQRNPNRGHISDGVIGFALLAKRPGSQQGLDHFGFEVEDVKEVVDRIKCNYPDLLFTKALSYVPFAGVRAQDPAGTQFDLSQKGQANVREGYLKDGWDQPRWLNHIALRVAKPDAVAEFYTKVLELKGVEEGSDDGSITLTDGKVRLLIRKCHDGYYRSLRQGFDHIGFKVDSVERINADLDELAKTAPEAAPKKIAAGMQGQELERDLQACPIGQHVFSDPDGILIDIAQ